MFSLRKDALERLLEKNRAEEIKKQQVVESTVSPVQVESPVSGLTNQTINSLKETVELKEENEVAENSITGENSEQVEVNAETVLVNIDALAEINLQPIMDLQKVGEPEYADSSIDTQIISMPVDHNTIKVDHLVPFIKQSVNEISSDSDEDCELEIVSLEKKIIKRKLPYVIPGISTEGSAHLAKSANHLARKQFNKDMLLLADSQMKARREAELEMKKRELDEKIQRRQERKKQREAEIAARMAALKEERSNPESKTSLDTINIQGGDNPLSTENTGKADDILEEELSEGYA